MNSLIPDLPDITDPALSLALQDKLDQKTKPQGSLGALEGLARRLGEIQGRTTPRLELAQ